MAMYYPSNWPTVARHKPRGERCRCGSEGTLYNIPGKPGRHCWACLIATLDTDGIEPTSEADTISEYLEHKRDIDVSAQRREVWW